MHFNPFYWPLEGFATDSTGLKKPCCAELFIHSIDIY
jgi:hypothetical protein